MKKNYLHPEYYAGQRASLSGDRRFMNAARAVGETALDDVQSWRGEGPSRIYTASLLERAIKKVKTHEERQILIAASQSENVLRETMICETFRRSEKKTIYRFNANFLAALSRMDVEIREELMPKEPFCAYFTFDTGILEDKDGDQIVGGYVDLRPPHEKDSDDLRPHNLVYRACAATKGDDIMTFGPCLSITAGLNFGDKFSVALADIEEFEKTKTHYDLDQDRRINCSLEGMIFQTFLNAAMYLHSLQPDVTHLKPVQEQTSKEQKEQLRKGLDLNNSPYPVVLVSWNYGKGVEYSKDSTVVRSHLRWQPCGPGFSQTKLVIIKEHERHFKNVKPNLNEEQKGVNQS